jgi:hypothetical protein
MKATGVPLRTGHPARSPGRSRPAAVAGMCIALCVAGWSANLIVHRSLAPRAAVPSAGGGSLGAGSAIAPPFGRGVAGEASASDSPATPTPNSKPRSSDLPPAVAALGTEPAVHALYLLGARARAGDAQAAFDAFEIADFCAATEASRAILINLPITADGTDRARRQARFDRDSRICDGVTPALLAERYRHVQLAAEGRIPGAAVRLLDAAQPAQTDAGDPDATNPPPAAWAERAIELARRDAQSGDLGALNAMTRLYQFGGVIDRDPDQALVFAVATEDRMQASAEEFSPGELAMQHLLVFEFESQLGAGRSDAAHVAASAIAMH